VGTATSPGEANDLTKAELYTAFQNVAYNKSVRRSFFDRTYICS
jgi:hypothetical protein